MAASNRPSLNNETEAELPWKGIAQRRDRCESECELEVRRERTHSMQLRGANNYSQVRSQYNEPPENGVDSYYTPNIQAAPAANEDPLFRDVLEMLKESQSRDASHRERLETFGPEEQLLDPKSFSKLKASARSKYERAIALSIKVSQFSQYLKEARQQLIDDYQTCKQLYDRAATMLLYGWQVAPSPCSEGSVCESIRVDFSYNAITELKYGRVFGQESFGNGSALQRTIEYLKQKLEEKDLQITSLSDKILEDSIKHQMECERLGKQNEQLNLYMQEVLARMEKERQLLRSKHEQTPPLLTSGNDPQEAVLLKQYLQNKDSTIEQLRAELGEQYANIQSFIACIRQLEASAAESVSGTLFAEKELEVADLNSKVTCMQNELERLEEYHEALKFKNFATEYENFCLLQRVESFESEMAEVVHYKRKELLKEIKELKYRISQLTDDNYQLCEQIKFERYERELKELREMKEAQERSLLNMSSNGHRRRKSHTEYEYYNQCQSNHSRYQDHPLFIEENNEAEELIYVPQHRQTQKSLNQGEHASREMLLEDIRIAYATPKHAGNHGRYHKTIRFEGDRDSIMDSHNHHHRRQYRESTYYKPTQPTRNDKVSPRSMFYPTPDHSSHLADKLTHLGIKPLTLGRIDPRADRCATNRTRHLDNSVERGQRFHRVEISNLELQLNNLSKELKSEISNIPARKHK